MPSATPGCPRLPIRFHLDKAEVVGSSPTSPTSRFAGVCCAADLRLNGCDTQACRNSVATRKTAAPSGLPPETSAYRLRQAGTISREAYGGRRQSGRVPRGRDPGCRGSRPRQSGRAAALRPCPECPGLTRVRSEPIPAKAPPGLPMPVVARAADEAIAPSRSRRGDRQSRLPFTTATVHTDSRIPLSISRTRKSCTVRLVSGTVRFRTATAAVHASLARGRHGLA